MNQGLNLAKDALRLTLNDLGYGVNNLGLDALMDSSKSFEAALEAIWRANDPPCPIPIELDNRGIPTIFTEMVLGVAQWVSLLVYDPRVRAIFRNRRPGEWTLSMWVGRRYKNNTHPVYRGVADALEAQLEPFRIVQQALYLVEALRQWEGNTALADCGGVHENHPLRKRRRGPGALRERRRVSRHREVGMRVLNHIQRDTLENHERYQETFGGAPSPHIQNFITADAARYAELVRTLRSTVDQNVQWWIMNHRSLCSNAGDDAVWRKMLKLRNTIGRVSDYVLQTHGMDLGLPNTPCTRNRGLRGCFRITETAQCFLQLAAHELINAVAGVACTTTFNARRNVQNEEELKARLNGAFPGMVVMLSLGFPRARLVLEPNMEQFRRTPGGPLNPRPTPCFQQRNFFGGVVLQPVLLRARGRADGQQFANGGVLHPGRPQQAVRQRSCGFAPIHIVRAQLRRRLDDFPQNNHRNLLGGLGFIRSFHNRTTREPFHPGTGNNLPQGVTWTLGDELCHRLAFLVDDILIALLYRCWEAVQVRGESVLTHDDVELVCVSAQLMFNFPQWRDACFARGLFV